MGSVLFGSRIGDLARLRWMMSYKPKNPLELLTIRAFMQYFDISVGLTNEGSKYGEFVSVDRKYRRPWKYYWDIDWEVSHV